MSSKSLMRTAGDEALGRNGKCGDKILKGSPQCSGLFSWDLLILQHPIWARAVEGKGTLWERCHKEDGFCNCLKPFLAINVFIFELKKGKKTKKWDCLAKVFHVSLVAVLLISQLILCMVFLHGLFLPRCVCV